MHCIKAGSEAKYVGISPTWQKRKNLKCRVTKDTSVCDPKIPVIFEGEEKQVLALFGSLEFTNKIIVEV